MRKKKFILGLLAACVLTLMACSQDVASPEVSTQEVISLEEIPEYSGEAYVPVNGNIPYFSEEDYTDTAFESYSDLDSLGRCGPAYANVCQEIMPTEDRGSISNVTPSGWVNNEYDTELVDGGYIYNRCHLIGFQLSGENDNEKNLITGTRYLNIEGMLPFENQVADYVKETDNHVLYRVTPVYEGENLVASGVLMEGWSVEDNGDGICFCVFAYNVQPGIEIDYATGDNWLAEETGKTSSEVNSESDSYVLNKNTMKFHLPSCSSVEDISAENREDFVGSRDDLLSEGYSPCGRCNP